VWVVVIFQKNIKVFALMGRIMANNPKPEKKIITKFG